MIVVLIRAPHTWPAPAVAAAAMLVLAVLDLGGSLAAKEAVLRRSPLLAALGAGLFVVLFWVYASSLQYADLAPVTFGWIVALQVGVVLLDRFRYSTALPAGSWVAMAVILVAQAYLLFAGAGSSAATADASPAGAGRHVAAASAGVEGLATMPDDAGAAVLAGGTVTLTPALPRPGHPPAGPLPRWRA
jgi:hypothetical protein